jgi:hypothetical protein
MTFGNIREYIKILVTLGIGLTVDARSEIHLFERWLLFSKGQIA